MPYLRWMLLGATLTALTAGGVDWYREIADAAGSVTGEQSDDLLACLYGLHALLCLHFTQEEENFFMLAPAVPPADR